MERCKRRDKLSGTWEVVVHIMIFQHEKVLVWILCVRSLMRNDVILPCSNLLRP